MTRRLRLTKFRDLNVADPFFDSLREGYEEFTDWFARKANESVYVVDDGETLSGFIYLKTENGPITDVEPNLPAGTWVKVGTLKINGTGTRLGERVIKKILDFAIKENADGVYVTVFEVHDSLIALFHRYGFVQVATKTTHNGTEIVLARQFSVLSGDIVRDYPFIHTDGKRAWLLAIYPEYHSKLLPDSILNNEPREIIEDVSFSNTIHKTYICGLALTRMKTGDLVVFYRTTDRQGLARYRSVATSVCVVQEVKSRKDFVTVEDFLAFSKKGSVYTEDELRDQWANKSRLFVAKLTYNAAFNNRLIRGRLMSEVRIAEQPRWDIKPLSNAQFLQILDLGGVNARLIVD